MKRQLKFLAAVLAAMAAVGLLVAVSGIIPIKASSGHWPITRWFLNFSMRRSVTTHSLGLQAPPLDDRRLVLQGAGHFETGCRPCHGSPDTPRPRIPQEMTPHPPDLSTAAPHWDPEELFYIVKHGVKFTGMPAWPARQRDDEVWAVTAFLLELPNLDAQQYRRLVQGDAENEEAAPLQSLQGPESVPPAASRSCARCHGPRGRGRGLGAFPVLAGQHAGYLQAALEAYAQGERHSGIMAPIAAALSPSEMRELARYYAALEPPQPRAFPESSDAIRRGKVIAQQGISRRDIPACTGCHGPSDTERNHNYPVLAGQYADYLVLQLQLLHGNNRGGSQYAHLMRPIASKLNPEQMRDVALYYAALEPAGASTAAADDRSADEN